MVPAPPAVLALWIVATAAIALWVGLTAEDRQTGRVLLRKLLERRVERA
jgi:hypothetical protein